jgi:hypothetical protein
MTTESVYLSSKHRDSDIARELRVTFPIPDYHPLKVFTRASISSMTVVLPHSSLVHLYPPSRLFHHYLIPTSSSTAFLICLLSHLQYPIPLFSQPNCHLLVKVSSSGHLLSHLNKLIIFSSQPGLLKLDPSDLSFHNFRRCRTFRMTR